MKALKYVGIVLLSVALGFAGATLLDDSLMGETDWQAYIEETIMPYITLAFSTVGTLCAIVVPIIKKVVTAGDLFKTATNDIQASIKNGELNATEIASYTEQLKALAEENKSLATDVANLTKMVKIGFCNDADLVKNGYAEEIAKVGETDENDEQIQL